MDVKRFYLLEDINLQELLGVCFVIIQKYFEDGLSGHINLRNYSLNKCRLIIR